MVMAQLRPQRLTNLASQHVKAARCFSTSAALRKEIQDAYILSAARTPTAKVSNGTPVFNESSPYTDALRFAVQWLVHVRSGTQARCCRHQVSTREVQGPR
jgi:hypothetical protein